MYTFLISFKFFFFTMATVDLHFICFKSRTCSTMNYKKVIEYNFYVCKTNDIKIHGSSTNANSY